MRGLQRRDQTRLGLESSYEVGHVGKPGLDDLDGDIPADGRLDRTPDDARFAFAELVLKFVATEAAARRLDGPGFLQGGVLEENALFEGHQLGGGFDAQLVAQSGSEPLVGA